VQRWTLCGGPLPAVSNIDAKPYLSLGEAASRRGVKDWQVGRISPRGLLDEPSRAGNALFPGVTCLSYAGRSWTRAIC
jgi:hypothetical protein